MSKNPNIKWSNIVPQLRSMKSNELSILQKQMLETEPSKRNLDRGNTRNLHDHWKDLNPIWLQNRHQRAVECSEYYLSHIKTRLHCMFIDEDYKNFMQDVRSGRKLSYEDIKKLDQRKKQFYTRQILYGDSIGQKYCKAILDGV